MDTETTGIWTRRTIAVLLGLSLVFFAGPVFAGTGAAGGFDNMVGYLGDIEGMFTGKLGKTLSAIMIGFGAFKLMKGRGDGWQAPALAIIGGLLLFSAGSIAGALGSGGVI
jgi:type IV secretory pathway VirB2 component (pilin)